MIIYVIYLNNIMECNFARKKKRAEENIWLVGYIQAGSTETGVTARHLVATGSISGICCCNGIVYQIENTAKMSAIL